MNWIKAVTIEEACRSRAGKSLSVFDIGCGRGGDAAKFRRVDISCYMGIDISASAIAEAKRRPAPCEHTSYAVCDAGSREEVDALRVSTDGELIRKGSFDVATSMLALHHAMGNPARMNTALDLLCDAVRTGGHVAIVIPDGSAVRRELQSTSDHPRTAMFTLQKGSREDSVRFTIPGASGMSEEEPIVDLRAVRTRLLEKGFELVLDSSPRALRSRFSDRRAQRRALKAPERLDQEQWRLADLYAVLVAKRRR